MGTGEGRRRGSSGWGWVRGLVRGWRTWGRLRWGCGGLRRGRGFGTSGLRAGGGRRFEDDSALGVDDAGEGPGFFGAVAEDGAERFEDVLVGVVVVVVEQDEVVEGAISVGSTVVWVVCGGAVSDVTDEGVVITPNGVVGRAEWSVCW